jgi:putative AdoMet-dependent methyltransferase
MMMEVNYNDIACKFDIIIKQDIQNQSFPYAGYQCVQDLITDDISSQKKPVKVLDLGCGTAKLYERLNPKQYDLVGIDNAPEMIKIAKRNYPNSQFIEFDILKGLPQSLKYKHFDYIIINYVFMHYSFKTNVSILRYLVNYLKKMGKIIISDLLFINPSAKQEFFYAHQDYAELDLHFHMYSQYVNQMNEQLALSYFEINPYTGMMIIENINEFTLLFEDPLVKYKTNTGKWKSTHPRDKRE